MEQQTVDNFVSWLKETQRESSEIYAKLVEISKKNVYLTHLNKAWVESSGARRTIQNFSNCIFNEYPKRTDENFIDLIRGLGKNGKSFVFICSDFWGYKKIEFYAGIKCLYSITFKSGEQEAFNKLVDLYHSTSA